MKDYYVEVYFPPYPNNGRKVRVFRKLVQDALSPSLIALYQVRAANRMDAMALVMMGAARCIIGKVA